MHMDLKEYEGWPLIVGAGGLKGVEPAMKLREKGVGRSNWVGVNQVRQNTSKYVALFVMHPGGVG
eukprot:CAMPEP_0174365384 /NCGR_PEP_ID=MMETSP0811_2-20130205/77054_1 /TAXON_ID=73025 ORGANISM="Eutreptiella gymnastica-like, Strain CCMP1594" /NCGR_SAMPLE_ID=MMETSP0811_2 /ASSEMBLY_ACC=CAM_ASM_000667 /LENGTH=64 /DNA_ID=CAMNT_0015505991 /DNA_START=176 /DNA_END=370 /DNA_ORIENTATION=+